MNEVYQTVTEYRQFIRSAPVFPVDDATKTADYYKNTLGFDIRVLFGDPAFYAVVQREGVRIHLSEREDTRRKIEPCSVYIFVCDIDNIYEEFRGKGVEMFSPPENQSYGMREFEMSDINGHFLVFGQAIKKK